MKRHDLVTSHDLARWADRRDMRDPQALGNILLALRHREGEAEITSLGNPDPVYLPNMPMSEVYDTHIPTWPVPRYVDPLNPTERYAPS